MHIITIDIGAYKTRIYSSKSGGSVVSDKLGNIDFSTIISLTKPRKYGASVNIELPMDTRDSRRGFFQDLKDPENQKCLYMYLEYLLTCVLRNGAYKYAVLTIPEYFDLQDRTILHDICKASSLNVEGFMYHLTGTAACMAFRRKDLERFMVLDFGFHKCSAGVFEMRDGELVPVYQRVLRLGAREFDDVLMRMIIEKYNFIDNNVTRERIQPMVYKFKKGFRDLEKVSERVLNDNYEYVNVEIDREDFIKNTTELASKLLNFVEEVFNEVENTFGVPKIVEVVGNNSYFVIVENIIEKYNYSTTLNASNSNVEGACFAYSVNNAPQNKHKVHEIVGNVISFKVDKEEKPEKSAKEEEVATEDTDIAVVASASTNNSEVKVFDRYSLQENSVVVKYMRRNPFKITVLADSVDFGKICVNKEKSEKPELVRILVSVNKFGLLEVKEVTIDSKPVPYEFINNLSLSYDQLGEIINANKDFVAFEEELEKFSKARCETQMLIDAFCEKFDRLFPAKLTEEEKKVLTDLENNYFRSPSSNYQEEIEMRKNLLENMAFLNEKLIEYEKIFRDKIKNNIEFIKPYVLPVCRKPRDMEFYAINKIFKDFEEKLYLTIENCIDMKMRYDKEFIGAENKVLRLVHEEELEKEEAKRRELEEEEARKREEEESKKREEEEAKKKKEDQFNEQGENSEIKEEENEEPVEKEEKSECNGDQEDKKCKKEEPKKKKESKKKKDAKK